VKADECLNGKPFFKSYGKNWATLTVDQKNKTVVFWNRNIDAGIRERILGEARQQILTAAREEQTRSVNTSKHDKARLLHLRSDPSAAADWTAALGEKTRAELDTDAAEADPWNRLAAKFNDYETNKYQNACIVPGRLNELGCYIAVTGMESIAADCHDLNPSMPDRPLRDAAWMRYHYRDLKANITKCYMNYCRSGNQEEENVYDEWYKFAAMFKIDWLTYSRNG
jgi:hypothetical protein